MQRSGSTVPAVRDAENLRELVSKPGPFVTIWANRGEQMPNAISSRVRDLRQQVQDSLPTDVVDNIEAAIETSFKSAPGVVVVAAEDGIRLMHPISESLRNELTLRGELPALAPVIEDMQAVIPFVFASVDRLGADLYWSDTNADGERTVSGDDKHITKVHAGGWSHARYQQRAENTWEHTASAIADELERLVAATDAAVVMLASEERMEQKLRERLSPKVTSLLREVTGSRTLDGSEDERAKQVDVWLRTAVASDTVEALQLFEQENGQLDRAANGAEATFAALRESRVDTLLIHDDGTQNRSAFFDREQPGLVALDRATFNDLDRTPSGVARAHDVAIRACLLTGAGVRIVPNTPHIAEGIAAILRW